MDFLMTYPCYIPLRATGEPFTMNAEGDDALPLFTDDDLVTRFVRTVSPDKAARIAIDNSTALSTILNQWQGSISAKGRTLSHVIIDPTPGIERARVYPIREFVAHILAAR